MLLTVQEACFVADIKVFHLYYLINMSIFEGAFKVLNCWRVDEESLREFYDQRVNSGGTEKAAADFRLEGYEKRLEIIRQKPIPDVQGTGASYVQGRKRMVCVKRRPDPLAGHKQLELWEAGNYW